MLTVILAAMLSACTQPAQVPTPVSEPEPVAALSVDATEASRTEKEIVNAAWMDGDFKHELQTAVTCQDVGVLVTTRGYATGDDVRLTVGVENGSKDDDVVLHGKVDADGKARVRWPAMGCEDHVPTPMLERTPDKAMADDPSATPAVAAKPSPAKGKKSSKPYTASPKPGDPLGKSLHPDIRFTEPPPLDRP